MQHYDHSRVAAHETISKHLGNAARIGEFLDNKYGLEHLENLKTKHVDAFVANMQERGLSMSTQASYMSTLRQIANDINKQNIVARTNKEYDISRAGTRLQPIVADKDALESIKDQLYQRGEWLGLAAELREQFGLRSGESIQYHGNVTTHADGTQSLSLSRMDGTKGSRPREVPIRTETQKNLVSRVQNYIKKSGGQSLMLPNMSRAQAYAAQRNALRELGAMRATQTNAHALRHAYAQERIINDGVTRSGVAEELGHGREDVVSHYVSK